MNLKKFSRAQFSKLRNDINGVGEFRCDTICSLNFVSIGQLVWKLLGGDQNLPQAYTQTDTHTHTHTHTHRGPFYMYRFLRKCRNTTKQEDPLRS